MVDPSSYATFDWSEKDKDEKERRENWRFLPFG